MMRLLTNSQAPGAPAGGGDRDRVRGRIRDLAKSGGITILLLLPLGAGLIALSCSGRSAEAPGPGESSGSQALTLLAAGTNAESILHHWQALPAIRAGDIAAATHHVEHIIAGVNGDHEVAMRGVLQDLAAGRFHSAEHMIQTMLAVEAELGLSPAMIHVQLALAALGRDDGQEAMHHLGHYIDAAPQAASIHGRAAMDALTNDEPLDALLHLRLIAQLEAEGLRDVTRCSGLGVASTGVHDGTITLLLLLDEEWAARHGNNADPVAMAIVAQAQEALTDLGIVLDVVGVERWRSPANVDLHGMSHAAATAIRLPGDAALLVVLTDQGTRGRTDGAYLESAGSHAVAVGHHRDRPQYDALVLVHEIGHLLDLTHAEGTYMQAQGFAEHPHWSECQKSAVARLLPAIPPTR